MARKIRTRWVIGATSILVACSPEPKLDAALHPVNDVTVESSDRATDVPGVLVGMTRDEVMGILGTEFISFTPLSQPPSRDSFPYTENGQQFYVRVQYRAGIVLAATDGHDKPYSSIVY